MNELVTTRIRTTATRLGLTHLPGQLDTFARPAEDSQMGYLEGENRASRFSPS